MRASSPLATKPRAKEARLWASESELEERLIRHEHYLRRFLERRFLEHLWI
jgi:hypothetical protein